MARKRSITQVIEEHLATASKEDLSSFIRAASLVRLAKYPELPEEREQKKRRGRPVGAKAKPNGTQYPDRTPGVASILGEPA